MTITTHVARVMTTFAVLCIATSCAQNSRTSGPQRENAEAGGKCPVMGDSPQTHGGWGHVESGLVAESTEPADSPSELAHEQSDG